jgi:hypothetical protein
MSYVTMESKDVLALHAKLAASILHSEEVHLSMSRAPINMLRESWELVSSSVSGDVVFVSSIEVVTTVNATIEAIDSFNRDFVVSYASLGVRERIRKWLTLREARAATVKIRTSLVDFRRQLMKHGSWERRDVAVDSNFIEAAHKFVKRFAEEHTERYR